MSMRWCPGSLPPCPGCPWPAGWWPPNDVIPCVNLWVTSHPRHTGLPFPPPLGALPVTSVALCSHGIPLGRLQALTLGSSLAARTKSEETIQLQAHVCGLVLLILMLLLPREEGIEVTAPLVDIPERSTDKFLCTCEKHAHAHTEAYTGAYIEEHRGAHAHMAHIVCTQRCTLAHTETHRHRHAHRGTQDAHRHTHRCTKAHKYTQAHTGTHSYIHRSTQRCTQRCT